jgi:hypothetical protein
MSSSTWVLTLNINGGNSEKTPNTFSDLLDRFNKSQYQGLLIQEPRYSDEHKSRDYNWEKLAELKKLKCLISSNAEGTGGVASLWKQSFVQQVHGFCMSEVVPNEAQLTSFMINGVAINICNIYANAHSGAERTRLFSDLQNLLPPHSFIAGDFNQVRDIDRDVWRPKGVVSSYANTGWAACTALMQKLAMHDGWRAASGPEKPYFTKITKTSGKTSCKSRIDYVLAPLPSYPLCTLNIM